MMSNLAPPGALAGLTTIGLGGPAPRIDVVRSVGDLTDLLRDEPTGALVLGGGSNLVVADEGITVPVWRMAIDGLRIEASNANASGAGGTSNAEAIAVIGAGVNWDDAVAEIVAAGWCGVEALSGIPGSAGATPVQNVGAYGVEIADVLEDVALVRRDRAATVERLPAAALRLGYRRSVLKGTDLAVVTEVRLRLSRTPGPVRYPELAAALGVAVGESAPAAEVRTAVLALRRRKGMVLDPADPDTRSAGSFFTNPIVSAARLVEVRARLEAGMHMPEYPVADQDSVADLPATKLSAAWLIQHAGFDKGYPLARRPDAGIALSTKHTLALTNRGGGTTAELLALARELRAGVEARFGVRLDPEPVLVGCSLDDRPSQ